MIRLIAALLLALPASAQVRVALPAPPALPAAIIPVLPAAAAPALPLAPALEAGRAFFDGAAAKAPAPLAPQAAIPARGRSVDLNGQQLPSRMFSDETQISGHLIRAIDATRVSLDIAIHGLALREVAEALSRAKKRGVRVRIVMNQTHVFPEKARDTRSPEIQRLIDEGFEMRMLRGGDQFGVMHNKIAIFDGKILETGSYNWTHAADAWHWENAMFLAEASRVAAFQSYWDWMWSISSAIPKKAPPVPVFEGSPPSGRPCRRRRSTRRGP
ncbi:MAG: phospholipase D-like domain-containing protein [Elusimicrobiota bacterium]|nr:MAG: phospholipase D-like domain-containing protein [Elusimicrobiota bacterium]